MTSTPTLAPATRRRPSSGREWTFEVELVGDDAAALHRVLTTLRRRRCVVTRVDFRVPDGHRPGWLTIGLQPPPAHGHVVEAWLANLVDVGAVTLRAC